MLIRTESPADILQIDALLKATFETDAEAKLVMQLRENSRFTLSMVACSDEGEIIGHLLFTPVTIDGMDIGWQGLAPLAIAPNCQGQGVARKLIEAGFDSLFEFGYPACFVLGDPQFYSRFGFVDATALGFTSLYHELPYYQAGAFQVISFVDDLLPQFNGLVEYTPEFAP